MQNEKMPIFLQAAGYMQTARSGAKSGAAPPSGTDPKLALARSQMSLGSENTKEIESATVSLK